VLVAWSVVLDPEELAPSEEGIVGILAIPLTLTMRALSRVLIWAAFGLVLLVFRDKQRSEYYADRLAVRLAGRDAALRMLQTLGNDKPYAVSVQALGIHTEGRDLISSLRAAIAATPPREHARLRRAEELEGSRLDYTHPPTAFRIEMLRAGDPEPPQLVLDARESEALDRELAELAPGIQADLADEARARLYA
jgi:heat shock protein HtpX